MSNLSSLPPQAVDKIRHRYAAKFIAEHDDPENGADFAEPTNENLAECFQHCARVPLPAWYPHIRAAVAEQRDMAARCAR